jgi:hypothetical protein
MRLLSLSYQLLPTFYALTKRLSKDIVCAEQGGIAVKAYADGNVVISELPLQDSANVSLKVEVHFGGIFVYLLITGIVAGKEERLRLDLFEMGKGGTPKCTSECGLGLTPSRLPGFSSISMRELFESTNGSKDVVITRLERWLVNLFVDYGDFRIRPSTKGEGMHIYLRVQDHRPGSYQLQTSFKLEEVKKFCLPGAFT